MYDDTDEQYVALQKKILYDQGKNWGLNLYGWNGQNETEVPICEWEGLACAPLRADVVRGINLSNQGIVGPILPDLGFLSSLVSIDLSENYISGILPEELGALPHLKQVKLNHNRISGRIPFFESHNIVEFNVSHNVFEGIDYFHLDFPKGKVVDEYDLDIFDASYNALGGDIGDNIAMMTKLRILDLGFNKLYGTIPNDIGDLKELKILKLNRNNIVGTIPTALTKGDLSLVDIDLSDNDLSGTIPTGLSNIRYLKNLKLTGNKLTGMVPSPLCNLRLNEDLFDDEKFDDNVQSSVRDGCNSIACPANSASKTGVYPCQNCGDQGFDWYLGHVGRCLYLNEKVLLDHIYYNTNGPSWKESTGWTIDHVDKCAYSGIECNGSGHVVAINLTDHGLSGTIPQEFGMFKYLKSVDLSDNLLTGYLPSDFRFLPLEYLDVSGNKLEGDVPPMLCLTGDINGNGENGYFNCDTIACPSGTWSPIGRASPFEGSGGSNSQKYSCQPCRKSLTFLASRFCGGELLLGSGQETIRGWVHIGSREFVAMMTAPLLVLCLIVTCVTGLLFRRRNGRASTKSIDSDSEKDALTSSQKKTVESKRTDLIGSTPSTRSALDFEYAGDDNEDNDDAELLLQDIGTGLPYRKELHKTKNLRCVKSDQVDDEISYANSGVLSDERSSYLDSGSHIEMTSNVESSANSGGTSSNAEEEGSSSRIESSSESVAGSTRSNRSRRSRGTNSRLSQAAELWLDIPEK